YPEAPRRPTAGADGAAPVVLHEQRQALQTGGVVQDREVDAAPLLAPPPEPRGPVLAHLQVRRARGDLRGVVAGQDLQDLLNAPALVAGLWQQLGEWLNRVALLALHQGQVRAPRDPHHPVLCEGVAL